MFAYSNGGYSMRAVDDDYVPETGEVLFADYATTPELVAAFPGYQEPVVRRLVLKSLVQQRLIDTGHINQAYGALVSNPSAFARWFAPDRPGVYADDPEALALLAAIGADPAFVLAE